MKHLKGAIDPYLKKPLVLVMKDLFFDNKCVVNAAYFCAANWCFVTFIWYKF